MFNSVLVLPFVFFLYALLSVLRGLACDPLTVLP